MLYNPLVYVPNNLEGAEMPDNLLTMPKKPTKPKTTGKTPRYPSREKIKYAGLPKDYWDLLESLTGVAGKYERRSVSFLATLAVRKFLQDEGLVDDLGKPKPKPGS